MKHTVTTDHMDVEIVLRILLGWSRESSARILHLNAKQVDERMWQSAAEMTDTHRLFDPNWESNTEEAELANETKSDKAVR